MKSCPVKHIHKYLRVCYLVTDFAVNEPFPLVFFEVRLWWFKSKQYICRDTSILYWYLKMFHGILTALRKITSGTHCNAFTIWTHPLEINSCVFYVNVGEKKFGNFFWMCNHVMLVPIAWLLFIIIWRLPRCIEKYNQYSYCGWTKPNTRSRQWGLDVYVFVGWFVFFH